MLIRHSAGINDAAEHRGDVTELGRTDGESVAKCDPSIAMRQVVARAMSHRNRGCVSVSRR